jgi:pimeloyl-ACP methyl ester carboxylesterase
MPTPRSSRYRQRGITDCDSVEVSNGIHIPAWTMAIGREYVRRAPQHSRVSGWPRSIVDPQHDHGPGNGRSAHVRWSHGRPPAEEDGMKEETRVSEKAGVAPRAVSITEHEMRQVERANATGLMPVVFVHGLWLLPSSWDRWVGLFEDAGYTALTPGWPDDPETVQEANAHPEVLAHKTVGQVADHFDRILRALERKPAVIGHSFGGLLAQILAGRGLAAVTVAIDPAPFRGVLPLPLSALKSAWPVLGNPANRNRAVPLTYDQFRFAFANAVSENEARQLYESYAVPASGVPLFQAATANLNPWTEAQVDTVNPDRGPLLIISGEKDNTVPWAIANASYEREQRNVGVTEIVEIPNRGHALTIDSGWREVAATALAFIQRF